MKNSGIGFLWILVLISLSLSGFSVYQTSKTSTGSISQEVAFKKYLEENPELIIASVTNHQQKQMQEAQKKAASSLESKKDQLVSKDDPIIGNKNGDVILVEFFDYACGYCKKASPDVEKLIAENSNLKVVHKHFPVLGPNSELAAKYALAANNIAPDKYVAFHEALMKATLRSEDDITAAANNIGIDAAALKSEISKNIYGEIINNNRAFAQSLNIYGTPAFIVGSQIIPGAVGYDALKKAVDDAK